MKNTCKTGYNCCRIIGGIFLVVATALTLLTHSDAGILGMFLVGLGFCISRRMGCKPCGCCGSCSCCCDCTGSCDTGMTCDEPAKKAAPRKKAKKTA